MNFEPCESLEFPPSAFTKREEETFEDYTAVTDWERFNSRFCLVFLLPHLDTSVAGCISANGSSNWSTSATRLAMAVFYKSVDVGFLRFCIDSIQLGSSVPHILDASDNIFDGHLAAPIACFGLTQALVLRPTEGEISGATRLHLLLSSVEMAVHAVRCILKPEGAPEWYLQLFLGTSHADRLSSRLKCFSQACLHVPEPQARRPHTRTFSTITSRISWLGADLPRLRNLLRGHSLPAAHQPKSSPDTPEYKLLGEQIIHHLLFLFPDADANFSSSSTMANELTQQSACADQPELLDWSRYQHRASREVRFIIGFWNLARLCYTPIYVLYFFFSVQVAQLASQLNLPPATSLTHRLAVLLCNLNYLQPNQSSDSQLEIMYNEFLLELKLRLDRRINLPTAKAFEESEQHSIALDPGERDDRAPTAAFTSRHNFSAFSDRERCNLHLILEHFNFYIEKARTSSSPSDSEFQDTQDVVKKEEDMEDIGTEPADEDEFFDASEDTPAAKLEPFSSPEEEFPDLGIISPDEASEEARSILQWLHSLDLTRLLRLLMPSVCLEALITFHSLSTYADIPFESHGWLRICLATWPFLLTLIVHTGSSTIVK
ncbi:hypothetical protein T265_06165 [Opisthorchis viverrini]|uniref:Uncharacterized protein n=1 Tax=Opisthorchis viverrini TaxID=6198 RepID=A0A074ZH99_OPIVI|nr:hypothetical protein T265_06165 [Opisthorchis viverrini]KER26588.1 hypothetical protein T265_06165 [Opisthorchis viverrini]